MMKNSKPCEHCGLPTFNAPDNANAYGVYTHICKSCVAKCEATFNDMRDCYSDLYKDLYGVRPRHAMPEDIEEAMNELQEKLYEQQEEERHQEELDSDYISTFYEKE